MFKRLGVGVAGLALSLTLVACEDNQFYKCSSDEARAYFNEHPEARDTLHELTRLLLDDATQTEVEAAIANSPAKATSETEIKVVDDESRQQTFYELPGDIELSVYYKRSEATTPEGDIQRYRLWHVLGNHETAEGETYYCGADLDGLL